MSKKGGITTYSLICAAVFIAAIVFIVFFAAGRPTYAPFKDNVSSNYMSGWKTHDGKSIDIDNLHAYINSNTKSITLKNTIPDKLAVDTSLNFRSKNILFTVSVGGQKIYTFKPDTGGLSGEAYGTCFHSIQISPKYYGKEITICAYPIYNDSSSFFNMMAMCSSGDYYQSFMHSHFIPFILCLITVLIGIVMLVISFASRNFKNNNSNLRSLGAFAVCIGTWSALETLVPQMLTGDITLIHAINYMLLIFMPYPAIQFVNSLLVIPKKLYTRISFVVIIAEFLITSALNWLNIQDYHMSLHNIIHPILAASAVAIFAMLIGNQIYCRRHRMHSSGNLVLIAFILFVCCSMADLLRYYLTKSGSSDAAYFMRIGILVLIAILSVDSIMKLVKQTRLASQTEAMRKLAYTDSLTQIPNRTSFLKKESELDAKVKAGKITKITVCQIDIDNLKMVNDTFGHAYGDIHIKAAAGIIKNAFKDAGDCFRIGGDEFTVFISGENSDEICKECLEKMMKMESEYNNSEGVQTPLTMSFGSSIYSHNAGDTIETAEKKADNMMYKNKSGHAL